MPFFIYENGKKHLLFHNLQLANAQGERDLGLTFGEPSANSVEVEKRVHPRTQQRHGQCSLSWNS